VPWPSSDHNVFKYLNRNELLLRVYKSADLLGCLHVKLGKEHCKVPGIVEVWALVAGLVQLSRAIEAVAIQEYSLRFCTVYGAEGRLNCCVAEGHVTLEILVGGQRRLCLRVTVKDFVLAVEGLGLNFPRFF